MIIIITLWGFQYIQGFNFLLIIAKAIINKNSKARKIFIFFVAFQFFNNEIA
jgi:hypothetical protein